MDCGVKKTKAHYCLCQFWTLGSTWRGSRREPTRELKSSGGGGDERMVGLYFRWEGDQSVRRDNGGAGLGSKAIGITIIPI